MSTMTTLPLTSDRWTVDDLGRLPDDGLRYELVDGALLVTPPPTPQHDLVATELGHLLHAALPREWVVLLPGSIELGVHDHRLPDLVVVSRRCVREKTQVDPDDVLLALEVMSPASVSTDRLVKPAQYAAAGIPHFWRIEPAGPLLVTHALDGAVYRETGRFGDEVVVAEPVPLRFRLADLMP